MGSLLHKPDHIPWTDRIWNPVGGCNPISEGCRNCYAKAMVDSGRLKGHARYPEGFGVIQEYQDRIPTKPFGGPHKKIFVADMSDLFHEAISPAHLEAIFRVIRENPNHVFQLLTKRSQRLQNIKDFPPNAWVGVTIENNRRLIDRVNDLIRTNAQVKFVSCEPLLEGFMDLSWVKDVDWIICGGESGPKRRSFDVQWARDIRDACREYGTPFFYKQTVGNRRDPGDQLLDGELIQEWPKPYNQQNTMDL